MKQDPNTYQFYRWLNETPIEKHKQPYRDICKDYGLEDSVLVGKLADLAFAVYIWHHVDQYGSPGLEDYQFRKDLATLAGIFGNGRNITIEATMPNDNGMKDKHTVINVEQYGLLRALAYYGLNSMLVHLGCIEKKNDLDGAYLGFCGYHNIGHFFKEPCTKEEIEKIIDHETEKIKAEKALMGRAKRTQTEIPRLGRIVHQFVKDGGDALAAMKIQKRYILIGDLMLAAGANPVEETDWKKVLSNKDKADKVKSWEKSYIKTLG